MGARSSRCKLGYIRVKCAGVCRYLGLIMRRGRTNETEYKSAVAGGDRGEGVVRYVLPAWPLMVAMLFSKLS